MPRYTSWAISPRMTEARASTTKGMVILTPGSRLACLGIRTEIARCCLGKKASMTICIRYRAVRIAEAIRAAPPKYPSGVPRATLEVASSHLLVKPASGGTPSAPAL